MTHTNTTNNQDNWKISTSSLMSWLVDSLILISFHLSNSSFFYMIENTSRLQLWSTTSLRSWWQYNCFRWSILRTYMFYIIIDSCPTKNDVRIVQIHDSTFSQVQCEQFTAIQTAATREEFIVSSQIVQGVSTTSQYTRIAWWRWHHQYTHNTRFDSIAK
jgi:hypothetical protein